MLEFIFFKYELRIFKDEDCHNAISLPLFLKFDIKSVLIEYVIN